MLTGEAVATATPYTPLPTPLKNCGAIHIKGKGNKNMHERLTEKLYHIFKIVAIAVIVLLVIALMVKG